MLLRNDIERRKIQAQSQKATSLFGHPMDFAE